MTKESPLRLLPGLTNDGTNDAAILHIIMSLSNAIESDETINLGPNLASSEESE
jgi:hypothetical protein